MSREVPKNKFFYADAAKNGNRDTFEWLFNLRIAHSKTYKTSVRDVCAYIGSGLSEGGHIELLQLLNSRVPRFQERHWVEFAKCAARGNQLDVLKWIRANVESTPFDHCYLQNALAHTTIDNRAILEWLLEWRNEQPRFTQRTVSFGTDLALVALVDFPDNIAQLEWIRTLGINFHNYLTDQVVLKVWSAFTLSPEQVRALLWFVDNGALLSDEVLSYLRVMQAIDQFVITLPRGELLKWTSRQTRLMVRNTVELLRVSRLAVMRKLSTVCKSYVYDQMANLASTMILVGPPNNEDGAYSQEDILRFYLPASLVQFIVEAKLFVKKYDHTNDHVYLQ